MDTAAADKAREEMVREGFAEVIQAQEFLRLSRTSVYKLMDDRILAYARFGRTRRIPWRALREYAASQIVG